MESLDDLRCIVCVKALKRSTVHVPCQKLLCGECYDILKTSNCPACTIKFEAGSIELRQDIDRRVRDETKVCLCGQAIPFRDYDDHCDSCASAQNTLTSVVRKAVVQPITEVANRSTFKCPFCPLKNFVRETLIEHIGKKHGKRSGVCPICVAMPWGDPNIRCDNLHAHMKHRHKYDVDTYTDFGMEDDEILRKVLEESKSLR